MKPSASPCNPDDVPIMIKTDEGYLWEYALGFTKYLFVIKVIDLDTYCRLYMPLVGLHRIAEETAVDQVRELANLHPDKLRAWNTLRRLRGHPIIDDFEKHNEDTNNW